MGAEFGPQFSSAGAGSFVGPDFTVGFSSGDRFARNQGEFNTQLSGTLDYLASLPGSELAINALVGQLRAGKDPQRISINAFRLGQQLGVPGIDLINEALSRVPPAATAMASAASPASSSPIQGGDVGFFDDFVSTATNIFGAAADIGGDILEGLSSGVGAISQTVQQISSDPVGAQILQALGVAVGGGASNNSTGSAQAMANGMTNPSTGSPMSGATAAAMNNSGMTQAGVAGSLAGLSPQALIAALRRLAGGPAGQIAVGVGSGLAVDQGLQALLAAGGNQQLMLFGEPPRNPLTGRRLSTLTFLDSVTGRPVVYKSQGTALLTTSDVSSARRVQRVARRAARGRRRSPARPPVVQLQAPHHHVCGSCLTSPCACK